MRRSLKLHYPLHPFFERRDDLEVLEVRSDMIVVRSPDGSRRGIPAWMFDPDVCNGVRKLSRPMIGTNALLEIAHLLELNHREKITARDERDCKNQTATGVQSATDPNTPSPGRGDSPGEANSGSRQKRMREPIHAVDRGGRRVGEKPKRRPQ